MPHLARHFIKLLPIVVATAVAACALGAPSDALAGTNGQQITVCPANSVFSYAWALPEGTNQNGQYVTGPEVKLGAFDAWNAMAGCVQIRGWWWVGDVKISWALASGAYNSPTRCSVPKWNPFTDVKRCEWYVSY